jgi:hypothetical protein
MGKGFAAATSIEEREDVSVQADLGGFVSR